MVIILRCLSFKNKNKQSLCVSDHVLKTDLSALTLRMKCKKRDNIYIIYIYPYLYIFTYIDI